MLQTMCFASLPKPSASTICFCCSSFHNLTIGFLGITPSSTLCTTFSIHSKLAHITFRSHKKVITGRLPSASSCKYRSEKGAGNCKMPWISTQGHSQTYSILILLALGQMLQLSPPPLRRGIIVHEKLLFWILTWLTAAPLSPQLHLVFALSSLSCQRTTLPLSLPATIILASASKL